MVRQFIKRLLGSAGYALFNTRTQYARDGLFTSHNDHFRNDPAFQAAYARGVKAGDGVDPHFEWRVHVALWAARTAMRVPGNFVECGVNAGFLSSAIMHALNWQTAGKRFYLIDTFSGPVLAQYSQAEVRRGRLRVAEEAIAAGGYVTDFERVRANYSEWPNVELVQGTVPDVLPAVNTGNVAFLHIDLNCAYPERAALEFFWERLSPGALVLFDDYAYAGNDCLTQAIDAAARSLGAEPLSLPTGQGLIIK
jgi:hypothetical protein